LPKPRDPGTIAQPRASLARAIMPKPTNIPARPLRRLLAGMRIRKKLIVLHTVFSIVLAGILLAVKLLDRERW